MNRNEEKEVFPIRPKKPLVSFMLYRKEKQKILNMNLKSNDIAKISKEISEMWKKENEYTKQKYHYQYENSKRLYEEQMKIYKKQVQHHLSKNQIKIRKIDSSEFRSNVDSSNENSLIIRKKVIKKKVKRENCLNTSKESFLSNIFFLNKETKVPKLSFFLSLYCQDCK